VQSCSVHAYTGRCCASDLCLEEDVNKVGHETFAAARLDISALARERERERER